MSKKDDKKKTLSPLQVKLLEDLATLTRNYKSTCKRLGTSAYSAFLQELSACTETVQPLTKVVCQGRAVDHVAVSALVQVLQSYVECRGLAFMGCNFADEALQAVSGLLLMGCGKWWNGPKLQLLEITCQGNTQHTGDKLPQGKPDFSQQQHSTSLVARLQTDVAQSSKSSGPADASNVAASAVSGSVLAPGSLLTAESAAARATPGAAPVAASETERTAGLGTVGISSPGVAVMPVRVSQARKPLKTISAVSPQVAMQQRLQQTQSSVESVSHTQVPPADLPVTFAVSTLLQPGPLFIRSFPDTGLDSSTTLPQAITSSRHSRVLTATTAISDVDEAGLWKSTTWGRGTAQRFGPEALSSLSSALGTIGVQLTVLTLSYVDLEDAGMHILCKGISRCSPLQKLTLSFCNVGASGAAFLAEAITPTEPPPGKLVRQPKLTFLDLQGNALGGEGMSKLCAGLAGCTTLAEVNFMAVGITEQHHESVRAFANVASCHPALQIINLDGNLIGDAGAALMLTAIQAKPDIWRLRVTRYISRPLMMQLTEQLASNALSQKAKSKKGIRKKASK
ncbi:TPA: NACHT, LRR and PYD domains-containing protein 12 [Trebouxia sp. C0004]